MDDPEDIARALRDTAQSALAKVSQSQMDDDHHRHLEEEWMESSLKSLNEISATLVKIEARMAANDKKWEDQEKKAAEQIRISTENIQKSMGSVGKLPSDLKKAYDEIFAPGTPMRDMLDLGKKAQDEMMKEQQSFKPMRRERISYEDEDTTDAS